MCEGRLAGTRRRNFEPAGILKQRKLRPIRIERRNFETKELWV